MLNDLILTFYLIMLLICIDHGDGRWKKTDGRKLQRDIEIFEEMAEQIESEINEYYEDEKELEKKTHKRISIKHLTNLLHSEILERKNTQQIIAEKDIITNDIYSNIPNYVLLPKVSVDAIKYNNTQKHNLPVVSANNWPKFEEILYDIGKQYDWKNDRWIKVKRKSFQPDVYKNHLHEKHNFKYRTVKLNRSKSRRNVVIAVTSVR